MLDYRVLLNKYGQLVASQGEHWELIVDEKLVGRMANILSSWENNNLLLVGPAGTGKTSAIQALDRSIREGRCPALAGASIFQISLDTFFADLPDNRRDERGSRWNNLLKEAMEYRTIVWCDEAHRLFASKDGLVEAAKPFLTDGRLRMILSTTDEELRDFMESNRAFVRRFERVDIAEPDRATTQAILLRRAAGMYPNLNFTEEICGLIVELSASIPQLRERHDPARSLSVLTRVAACAMNQRQAATLDFIHGVIDEQFGDEGPRTLGF